MKKYVLLIVTLFTFSSFALAQEKVGGQRPVGKPDKEQIVKMRTERMAQELGLNEAQKTKLLELNTKYADMFQFMRPPHRNGRPGANMRPGGGQQPQMQTPDGDKKLKDGEMKKEGDKNMRDNNPRPFPNDERAQAMFQKRMQYEEELSQVLTEEQMAKYKEQRMNRRPRMQRND
jgi:hypothetical protein